VRDSRRGRDLLPGARHQGAGLSPALPRGPLLGLGLGAALLFTAFFMTGTLAPLFGVALGASPAAIGVVISAAFLFPLFLAVPVGTVVDAVGPKPMLLLGTALLAIAPVWIAIAPSFPSLLVAQVLAGLGQLIAVVAAQSMVARLGDGADRESNFGLYGAFVSVGQLLGPVTAGVLVDLAGFRTAYVVAAVVAAAGTGAFAMLSAPAGGPAGRSRRPVRVGPRKLLSLTRLPTVQVSLWVSGTVMIVLVTHGSFLPAFLDGLAVPASVIGIVISARSLASVAIRPFMAAVIARLGGRMRTFLAMLTVSAVGLAMIVAAPSLVVLLASSALLGLAVGVAQPLTMVGVVEQIEVHEHGMAFGARITANRLVQFVAPLILGLVAQVAGYVAMFLVAALAVGATVASLTVRRDRFAVIERDAQGSGLHADADDR